ncbi:MAG: uracil-DNA glycosylase [Legionella sp.]|nr:uracil-DNA glycosylase [Legionella sp.]
MYTPKQQYYLQLMGIDTWVQRSKGKEQPSASALANQDNISSLSRSGLTDELDVLAKTVASCQQCPLYETRTQTVFARGNPRAKLMIIGEAPGYNEDKQGLPFVGKAGHLLNQMLASIGLSEETVYIANVLKCRPPNNRNPQAEEILKCGGYLNTQINLVKPTLLLGLGRFAAQFLTKQPATLSKLRQQLHHYQTIPLPFFISYHPAYLLRNPIDKKKAYLDLLQVKQFFS